MLGNAIHLLLTVNRAVFLNLANAVEVAGYILILGMVIGIPIGLWIGIHRFSGRRLLLYLLHFWLFLPMLGLGIFLQFVSTEQFIAPLGFILWGAMLTIPIVAALIADTFGQNIFSMREEIQSVGATRWQLYSTLVREHKEGVYGAITMAIARVFTEIGAFYLIISYLFHTGFPSKPIFVLAGPAEHLATALGLIILELIVYSLLFIVQFGRDR